jgi:hypothetical protein
VKKLVIFVFAAIVSAMLVYPITTTSRINQLKQDMATTQWGSELCTVLNELQSGAGFSTGSVTSTHILDSTIVSADIATGGVASADILDGTIATADFAAKSVDSAAIGDDVIVAGDIASGAVATAEILDGTILAADFSAGAVDSTAILDSTVAKADMADDAVGNAELDYGTAAGGFVTLLAQYRFFVADAASTDYELGGPGLAASVDHVTFCASGTVPVDGGTVLATLVRNSDGQNLLAAANFDVEGLTADDCAEAPENGTAANRVISATDSMTLTVATDGTVDTNGTEITVSVWGRFTY